jgi:hypothetical protein
VLFGGGLGHARRAEERVRAGEPRSEPLRRVRREGVTLYHLSQQSSREVMAEPAYL